MNVLNANNASNTTHYEIVALKSEYKEQHKRCVPRHNNFR